MRTNQTCGSGRPDVPEHPQRERVPERLRERTRAPQNVLARPSACRVATITLSRRFCACHLQQVSWALADSNIRQCDVLTGSLGKGQKEGQEDQGSGKLLGRIPLVVLMSPGPPALLFGFSLLMLEFAGSPDLG